MESGYSLKTLTGVMVLMMILAFVSQSQAVTLSNALQITENHILIAQIGQFDSQAEIGRPANAAFPEGSAASCDTEYELYHAGGDIENASDQPILFIAS